MSKLIKMDLRRMLNAKLFRVLLIITASLNLVFLIGGMIFIKMVPEIQSSMTISFADQISVPVQLSLMSIMIYMSVVSFSYADFAGGYIKNLAGQVGDRGKLVISKFVVMAIHNFIFLFVCSIANIVAAFISIFLGSTIEFGADILPALLTFLLKWLLVTALGSILIFITNGIRSKTFAVIMGVIFGAGALNLLYMGVNFGVMNVLRLKEFNISDYMPDQLVSSVDVATNTLVLNGVIAAIVCIALFLALTLKLFKSKDIK